MSDSNDTNVSRRDFLALSSTLAAATALGFPSQALARPGKEEKNKKKPAGQPRTNPPNILFVFTDQERFFDKIPSAFPLPGHKRLAEKGTTFTSHQISACMCTSSRAVMLTGLQTADNGMFENVDTPYVPNMSTKIPTLGHLLRKAGYHTAYKGKWHLNRDFEVDALDKLLTKEMEEYGFGDYFSPGDAIAHTLGGYEFDNLIGGSAISWLRRKGRPLSDEKKPWAMVVSLINPHDIMYFNADAPGENVQDTGKLLMHAARAPDRAFYRNDWRLPLPASLRQPLDEAGRPQAHSEFMKAWGYTLGTIPPKDANWHRFNNYYLNSIRAVDQQLLALLTELEDLGMADDTVIVFTADHGEMAGSHGLRGKGPFAYRETMNVPFYIVHPDVAGGRTCQALTSHIDIVPTLLSIAGADKAKVTEWAGRELPGKDISPVLQNPAKAEPHAVRDKTLFAYSGIATNDSEMIRLIAEAKAAGKDPKKAIKEAGYKPNLKKRGSVRTVFDGRYKFSRYFSPLERNSPKTLDELFAHNDVELFDLKTDPTEMKNLALDRKTHGDLLLAMNAKLADVIKAEFGADDGREMPKFPGITWAIDRIDL